MLWNRLSVAIGTAVLAFSVSSDAIEASRAGRLSPADLAGIWEAIQVNPMRMFVAELHEHPQPSYVAMVGSDATLFVVHRMTVNGTRFNIDCDGTGEARHLSLRITGSGWAANGEGKLDTTFTLMDADGKRVQQQWRLEFINYRGRLTEGLLDMKNKAGEVIGLAKKAAPSAAPAGTR